MATVKRLYGATLLETQTSTTTTGFYACTSDTGVHFRVGSLGVGATKCYVDVIRTHNESDADAVVDLDNLQTGDYSRNLLAFDDANGIASIFSEMARGTLFRIHRDAGDATSITLWAECFK